MPFRSPAPVAKRVEKKTIMKVNPSKVSKGKKGLDGATFVLL